MGGYDELADVDVVADADDAFGHLQADHGDDGIVEAVEGAEGDGLLEIAEHEQVVIEHAAGLEGTAGGVEAVGELAEIIRIQQELV